jgi:hypothetical protein
LCLGDNNGCHVFVSNDMMLAYHVYCFVIMYDMISEYHVFVILWM